MKNGWDSDNVQQDPTKSLGEGIEDAWATSAPESEADGEVELGLPPDAEHVPLGRMNGNDFEGIGDVCFGEPGSLAGEFN